MIVAKYWYVLKLSLIPFFPECEYKKLKVHAEVGTEVKVKVYVKVKVI